MICGIRHDFSLFSTNPDWSRSLVSITAFSSALSAVFALQIPSSI